MKHLILEACNRIDFEHLPKVTGLERLELLGCKGLTQFSWLEGCTSLKRLVVTATPAMRLDLPSLQNATANELYLAIPKRQLLEVSTLLPHATVSNGDVWFRDGKAGVGRDPLSSNAID